MSPGAPSDLFVGRDAELAELQAGLVAAASGAKRLFLIEGEPGIGKTRLVEELLDGSEALPLWGRCSSGEGTPPYWPWVQIVRTYEGRVPGGFGAGGQALLQAALGEATPGMAGSDDPDRSRFLLFDAVGRSLSEAASRETLAVVIDDLHLADELSLRLLEFIARTVVSGRLLVLATFREHEARIRREVTDVLGALARDGMTIHLEGLSREDVERFLDHASEQRTSHGLVDDLYRSTDGNPLFVTEVVRTLLAEGSGARRLAAGSFPIPPSIRQVIRGRLASLKREARAVVSTAALLGREFDLATLDRLCGLERDALMAALTEGVTVGVMAEIPGAAAGLRFSHDLVREVVLDELPPEERLRMHRMVGGLIEEQEADEPRGSRIAELAYHYVKAAPLGDVERAVGYAVRAAERSFAVGAYDDAIRWYEAALGTLRLGGERDAEREGAVLLALGRSRSRAGHVAEARAAYSEAAEIARETGLAPVLADAALGFASETLESGVVDRDVVRRLEEALEAIDEGAVRVELLSRLAIELSYSDDVERREGLAAEAVAIAERLEDRKAMIAAYEARFIATSRPESVERRLADAREVFRLSGYGGASETEDPRGHLLLAQALFERGDIHALEKHLDDYAALAERLSEPSHVWFATMMIASMYALLGQFAEAQRASDRALDAGRQARAEEADTYFTLQAFVLARELGRRTQLEQLLGELDRLARRSANIPAFRAARIAAQLETGSEAAARIAIARLVHELPEAPRNLGWLAAVALSAEVVAALDERELAATLYELLVPHAGTNVVLDWSIAGFGSASRHLGLLARLLGRHDEAATILQRAVDENEVMGATPAAAHARRELGMALVERDEPGDGDHAARVLSEAQDAYASLGMGSWAAVVEGVLVGSGGGAIDRPPRSGAAGVFRREGEYWAVAFEEDAFRLKHTKGLVYLAELLRRPGEEVHALDLVSAADGIGAGRPAGGQDGLHPGGLGDAGSVLDEQAKRAYKDRLRELQDDLEEAEANNDPERAARAREEIDFIAGELASAVGLGGRDRKAASVSERARVAVTRAIRAALKRIGEHSGALSAHLDTTVKTGTFCSYTPDPRAPIDWRS